MKETMVTKDNFDTEVLKSEKPVLIDFYADWCGPCKMLSPIIAEIAEQYDGKVKVCKVNVDEQPELASKFQVVSIPMVFCFKNGKPAGSLVGYRPKEEIEKLIK